MVRAKFHVCSVAKVAYGKNVSAGSQITLTPQYDTTVPEDQRFAKATPSGTIQMFVDNPSAEEFLKLGKCFYIDFTEVPEETVA